MPLVVSEHVGEDLRVRLLAFGLEMKTHFALLSAALQLQQSAEKQTITVLRKSSITSVIALRVIR